MRQVLFLFLLIFAYSCAREQERRIIQSDKSSIKIFVNGAFIDWTISPDINPDRCEAYCSKEINNVKIITDKDSAVYSLRNLDTIRLKIILKSKDTAYTEIIGIRDLPNKISNNEKVYWLGQIWSEIKYNFVNIDRLKFNLDSLYKSYIPLVINTKNDYEYYRTLKKFAAKMHDGHTQVTGDFSSYYDFEPIAFRDFNKKVYVTSILKKQGMDSTWLGAELIEIEGIPTSQYLESKIFPYISASTDQSLWMQGVTNLQNGLRDQHFIGTIRKSDGTLVKLDLPRNCAVTSSLKDEYWGPYMTRSKKAVDLTWIQNGIAFVSFNSFLTEKQSKEFDKIASEMINAKGVIIDLRRNGGGITDVALHLQMYLTKGNHFLSFGAESRVNDGYGKSQGNYLEEYKKYFLNKAYRYENPEIVAVSDTVKRIKCPVVILTSRYTFSAAEDFLVNIYEVPGRPLLIGEETGGSSGAPLLIPGLPGDLGARVCTLRECFPISGKPFINTGIKPDIEVKQTIEDYLAGKDVVLERAVIELNK